MCMFVGGWVVVCVRVGWGEEKGKGVVLVESGGGKQ